MTDRPRHGRRAAAEPAEPPGPEQALAIAAHFLGTRPRTRWELERRLRRAGTDDAVIAETLERLAELGYVDDAAFARWWGEQRDRHAPRGKRMIEAELRQRGVPSEVIQEHRTEHAALDRALEDAALPGTEAERARDALERHLRGRTMPTEAKALQRIGMYLMRRGFDPETARRAIRELGTDAEDVL